MQTENNDRHTQKQQLLAEPCNDGPREEQTAPNVPRRDVEAQEKLKKIAVVRVSHSFSLKNQAACRTCGTVKAKSDSRAFTGKRSTSDRAISWILSLSLLHLVAKHSCANVEFSSYTRLHSKSLYHTHTYIEWLDDQARTASPPMAVAAQVRFIPTIHDCPYPDTLGRMLWLLQIHARDHS